MATDLISDDEDLLVAPACAPVPACVVPCVSTDIFSDDEDQPVSASLAVPPPVNVPAELRSVVVAEMDLVDSDEEQIEALQVPGAESQHLAAKPETIPPSLAAGLVVAAPSQTTTAEKSGDSDDDFNLTGLEARGPHDSHGTVDGTKRKAEVGDDAKDNIKRRAESAKPEDAKPKEKEKKLSKEEMETRVLDYMQQQNRPYNAQNVFDNLHAIVPKSQVQVIMDCHVATSKLVVKEYGKSKMYMASQVANAEEIVRQAEAMRDEVTVAAAASQELRVRVEETKKAVGALRAQCALRVLASDVAREVEELRSRLHKLQGASRAGTLSESDINRIEQKHERARHEWKRRKSMCMEVLYRLSELGNSKLSDLIDMYGIDTDESCGH